MRVISVDRLSLFYKNSRVEFLKSVYPVGSVYMSISSVSPSELFGFGEWEQIKDVFLLSAGDTYASNSTGGVSSQYLTMGQTPFYKTDNEVVGYGLEITGGFSNRVIVERPSNRPMTAINNMPPYFTVYMWQRIS